MRHEENVDETGSSGSMGFEGGFTHVIQAPWWWPKASCHAGSRDWKNSSGWKKVRSVRAFTMRNASSRANTLSVE